MEILTALQLAKDNYVFKKAYGFDTGELCTRRHGNLKLGRFAKYWTSVNPSFSGALYSIRVLSVCRGIDIVSVGKAVDELEKGQQVLEQLERDPKAFLPN